MIIQGDCMDILPTLEAGSVHTCVTSPPYFGLRKYGDGPEIGAEPTPDEFVAALVAVFREVRRALRDDGTVWLNLGDSYAGAGPSGASYQSKTTLAREGKKSDGAFRISKSLAARGMTYADKKPVPPPGLKPKDLIGIPWRVAFALQADGWYLRQDIIWHKPNPMPESVRDRCTKAHEYIFMLSKSSCYFYDQEAIKEPLAPSSISRLKQNVSAQIGTTRANGGAKINGNFKAAGDLELGLRNKRSVWTVTTKPFRQAHFATFPRALIEPCILAGAPKGGLVLDPFAGAGTTWLAAHDLGRRFIGCELYEKNVALAEERLAAHIGKPLQPTKTSRAKKATTAKDTTDLENQFILGI